MSVFPCPLVGDCRVSARGLVISVALCLSAVVSSVVWLIGSANPHTPAGYVGYLTKAPSSAARRFRACNVARPPLAGRGCST